jgi:membrane-associated phospholipid phosphatase
LTLRDRLGAAAVCVVLLMTLYVSVARWMALSPVTLHELPTALDRVAFFPPAVMVYGLLYAHVVSPLVLVEDRRTLLRGGLAYFLLVCAGVPFWVFFPVTVPRPELLGEGWLQWAVAVVWWIDPPTNCFPSMHVGEAFLSALLVRRLDRRLGHLLLLGAVAIWWSTLALAQHWFVDGLVGLTLAVVVDQLVFGWRPLAPEALRCGPTRRMGWLALVYGALFVGFMAPWWLGLAQPSDLIPPWVEAADDP